MAPWNGHISKSFDFTTSADLGAFGPDESSHKGSLPVKDAGSERMVRWCQGTILSTRTTGSHADLKRHIQIIQIIEIGQ